VINKLAARVAGEPSPAHFGNQSPPIKTEISSQLGQKKVSGHLNKVIRDLLAAKRIGCTIPNKPNSAPQPEKVTPDPVSR
jgi:hypothetical protein